MFTQGFTKIAISRKAVADAIGSTVGKRMYPTNLKSRLEAAKAVSRDALFKPSEFGPKGMKDPRTWRKDLKLGSKEREAVKNHLKKIREHVPKGSNTVAPALKTEVKATVKRSKGAV